MRNLALSIENFGQIQAPQAIPTGGLEEGGVGQRLIQSAATYFLIFGILLALIFITYAGIQWIMSGGDKTKVEAARGRIIYAIVGLVIMLLAYFIVKLIGGFFNVNLLPQS